MPDNNGVFQGLLESPESVLKLIICGLLAISVMATIVAVSFSSGTVPRFLAISCVCIVALCAVLNKNAIVVTIVILVVGHVVASEDYLINIVHMITGTLTPVKDYRIPNQTSQMDNTEPAIPNENATGKFIGKVIESEGDGKHDTQADRRRINEIAFSQLTLPFAANLVQTQGAQYPLQEVINGKSEQLANEYGEAEYFTSHMNLLRSLGLISFDNSRFNEAIKTELGEQVLHHLQLNQVDRGPEKTNSLFANNRPDNKLVDSIKLKEPKSDTISYDNVSWQRFTVDDGEYLIEVDSDFGDPLLRLYDAEGFKFIAEDDDGGSALNSKIQRQLKHGTYYTGITNLFSGRDRISITITKRD